MAVNKVIYGTTVLVDLTEDTVSPESLMQGYTAHDKSGALITGTATGGGSVSQDSEGYIVLPDQGGGSSVTVDALSITENGTYTAPTGHAYSPVTVNVSGGEEGLSKEELKALIQRDATFTSVTWPDGVTKIGSYAFAHCSEFSVPSLPDTVTQIGSYAFSYCSNLALTSLPSGVTIIDTCAFQGCSNLALTSLPSGITSIPSSAFYDCTNLRITSLPSGVNYIGTGAFQYCSSIPSISCEGAIKTLTGTAFNGSSYKPMSLASVSFPNMSLSSSLGTVFGSTTAANACRQLEFCDIGTTGGIAANAFANCYALETLVLRKKTSVCTLANVSAFLNTPMRGYNDKTGKVYVPSARIESYKTATNWKTLYNDGTVEFLAIEGSEYER